MRHRDFCFWLQGAFEICDPPSITAAQVECIKRHLALVDESQKDVKRLDGPAAFCRTLKILLQTDKNRPDGVGLNGTELAVVKKLLNAEFVHIDADTEGDQDAMDEIHHGKPPRPGPGVMRC